MLIRILPFLLLFASLSAYADANLLRYQAGLDDSKWEMTSSTPTLCRIEHNIPRFGKAVFSQASGRGLRLELISMRRFKKGIEVELVSESTSWQSTQSRVSLARLKTSGLKKMLRISGTTAEQAYRELNRGMQPGFRFALDHPLQASLSTVRFREIEQRFNQCAEALHYDNFADVRVSHIHFDPDQEFPRLEEENSAFRRMFDYLAVDKSITEVVVTGHADPVGKACYNERLSEGRALYVYDLLIAKGLDSKLLRVDYSGEQKLASKGTGKKALAANRRVTVELRR